MTTFDQRQQESKQLCQRLMARIGDVASAVPIAHWPPIVDEPSVAFMVALSAWEIDPSDLTMECVCAAHDGVLEAWRIAAHEFTTERSEA